MDAVYVSRDADGAWRIEGDDRVIIVNLANKPPSPVATAVEEATGRAPVAFASVLGPRGTMRFLVRFES